MRVLPCVLGLVVDWAARGARADDPASALNNTRLLNAVLAGLGEGDTLVVQNATFWVAGGVRLVDKHNVTLRLDGTLKFLPGRKGWPTQHTCGSNPLQPTKGDKECVQEAFFIANVTRLTLTTGGTGILHGGGKSWWGYMNYLIHGENRPRLISMVNATDVLVDGWHFLESAYWTFTALDVARLEVVRCAINNRVDDADEHTLADLGAFNTDGFDVAGRDIYIHDSQVWNQDDCFTIQPMDKTGHNAQCTENVLVENVKASGLGLTVGAVRPTPGHNCVRNVTFRNASMHHTFKGIYIKSQFSADPAATGEISNILYDGVEMDGPTQVPIWIGPAQEADSSHACSLGWPEVPFTKCPPPPTSMLFANITLRNVKITSPKQSPGIVLGNPASPMKNVVFENVVVTNPGPKPWGKDFYKCQGVDGTAVGGTSPVPPCFTSPSSAIMV